PSEALGPKLSYSGMICRWMTPWSCQYIQVPNSEGSRYAITAPESIWAMRPPMTSCFPRPNRLPCTNSRPNDLLLADQEAVGTGAQGNLSFTEMLMRMPEPCGSHQTFTSANRPVVFSRSRTVSSVSLSSVSPILTPAMERTV